MKVRMRVSISGTRDGEPWPPAGQVVDLPDEEARHLCAGGLAAPAVEDNDGPETATAPAADENTAGTGVVAETPGVPAAEKRRARSRKPTGPEAADKE
jgi:hypothetical protein